MQYKYLNRYWLTCLPMFLVISLSSVNAQENRDPSQVDIDAQVVEYDAEFFSRYHPNTALDMVRQLPGFTIDDGTDNRGFASSVGNILINDR
ncbi:MAG: hypothetical protein ACI9XC_001402, partial [Gammaproteobacteria bacterium]